MTKPEEPELSWNCAMTKPSYEELEQEVARLGNALGDAARALPGVAGSVEHRIRMYRELHSQQISELESELARVRGLLQRGVEYIKQYGCSDSKCRDAGHVEMKQWLAESADIGKLDSADKSCPTCKRPAGYVIGVINESKVLRADDIFSVSQTLNQDSMDKVLGSAETGEEKA